ncbi:hypothetical protein F2Q68_00018740 [Brassica cretica]|uniref:NB-ARC domain-containing protein n=1 Tax=Brassica cretica TaxID=69181 RepID=A0A8S9FUM4_BRACR|nr:hypothetical protein F2Q68_00018740 [Brassica cretica]
MAETLLSFGVERLWNLLVRESERFQGFNEQLNVLKNDMKMLRCFLEDAYAKKHTSAMMENIIKEIVLDAEDMVETFLLKEELKNTRGIKNSARKFSCSIFEHRGLAFSMEAISKRISKVIRDMMCHGVQQKNVEILVGYLLDEDSSPVVSITGMGGIGKTTLARKVYNHQIDYKKSLSKIGVGCKVLHTSRNEGVALHADRQCVTFKPKCLTFEESWDLFQRIAFPMKDTSEFKIDEEMKEMGKQMIKHCGGLPLALKVLGGLLAAQYTLCEWKKIYENIGSYIVGGTSFNERNVVYHVLYLSFEELPAYLKHCFLYLAHFPEDYKIDVEDLSYYWAAEGIQRPRYYAGASIRELHDMMREVCLLKAEEEDFVEIIQGTSTANSKSSCKSRRLVVHKPDETFNVDTEVKNPSLRTLLFIKCRGWRGTSLFFTRHKLMRVLDLSRVKFEGWKVPSSIGKLIHLRYLSLFCASVNRLPSSMRNMKQLLYLNLEVHSNRVYMPNILKEMRELVYLHFPLEIKNKVKMELGNLVKLETLENFSTEHGSVDDLRGMTRLKTLSIYIRGKKCNMETLSSSLSKLPHLENLTIDKRIWYALPNDDKEEGFFLDCIHLKKLKLYIYMPKFPDEQQFPFHLTTISLTECCLKEDPMPVLEKLLHLKEVSLLYRSFRGRRMVCSRGGFPQLQMLRIRKLEELEDWIVEEGSMPFLYTLEIDACKKLKEIPEGLRFITYLEDLSVTYMGEQWGKRLLEEGEDYHKIQHIPSVEFY